VFPGKVDYDLRRKSRTFTALNVPNFRRGDLSSASKKHEPAHAPARATPDAIRLLPDAVALAAQDHTFGPNLSV
jgi:hypothetical protein